MRTTVGLRFLCRGVSMEYSKRPIDIPEQISILTSRGLVIDSESFARQQFSNISYFRLASYWKPFEVDSDTHDLEKGTLSRALFRIHLSKNNCKYYFQSNLYQNWRQWVFLKIGVNRGFGAKFLEKKQGDRALAKNPYFYYLSAHEHDSGSTTY